MHYDIDYPMAINCTMSDLLASYGDSFVERVHNMLHTENRMEPPVLFLYEEEFEVMVQDLNEMEQANGTQI